MSTESITIESKSLLVDYDHGASVLIELKDLRSEEVVDWMDRELELYKEAFFGIGYENSLIRFDLSDQAQWNKIEEWLRDRGVVYKIVSIENCEW